MKKFLLGALCCACVSSVYAGTCEKTSIEYKGVQQSADDEFLYENDTDSFLGSGYECDNEFCEDGVTVTMFPGHFYKDEKVNETVTYKCSTGVTGDKWEPVSNDVSGDIVSTRWCDNVTKEGEYNWLGHNDIGFEEQKATLEDVYIDNKHVARIKVLCTRDGWSKPEATSCFAPYVVNDEGLCEHYTTYLTNNLESREGLSFDAHKEILGMPDVEYYNYREGSIDDMEKLIDIMSSDAVLIGRFSH